VIVESMAELGLEVRAGLQPAVAAIRNGQHRKDASK